MKKILIFFVGFVFLLFSFAFSAEKKVTKNVEKSMEKSDAKEWSNKKNVITTNPVGLILGSLNAHYEFALDSGSAIAIEGMFYWYDLSGWTFSAFGIGGEYNFYFDKKALNAWYVGPGVGFAFINASYKDPITAQTASSSSPFFYLNGHGGYRWIWDSFTVDVKFGLQYYLLNLSLTVGGTTQTLPFGGIAPLLGVNVGLAF